MKWFVGTINEAVAVSKSRKAVFVVFVEGKDDVSMQLAQAIDTTEISSRLEKQHFVAIRLESGSEAYRFFAQIYQLVPVPSLFFIGENGTPLEIVAGNTTAIELASKIDNVLVKAGKSGTKRDFSSSLIDAEQRATATSSSSSSNNNAVEATTINTDNIGANRNAGLNPTTEPMTISSSNDGKDFTENIVKTSSSTENQNNNEVSKNDTTQEDEDAELTAEEKIERARQLITLQRKQRLEEEQKKDREQEIQRRQMGRDVQKMRQTQQELQIKQAQEERMREKAAENAAREKVRQQIAQDKLERKQKELELQQQAQQKQPQKQFKHSSAPSTATVARIQFRLPSGNSYTGQFEPTNTLRTLRTYVIENIDLPFRQFVMSTSFPRRELTNEENDKTLLELELVPTAVILILPLKNVNSNVTKAVTSTQNVGFFSRLIWSFFTPVIHIYNYIIGYFSGTNGEANRHNDSTDDSAELNNPDRDVASNQGNVVQPSGFLRRYLSNEARTTVRAQGNVHRLHSGGDDNDENNTWNGNSTQQM